MSVNLEEVIAKLQELPEATFICARKPWNHGCEAVVVPFPEDLRIPETITNAGYEYFLEVSTANEILEGFLERKPTLRQTTDFIIYYAEHDAFPQWADQI